MNEFEFIAKLLSPLAQDKAALNLADDAAVLDVPSGQQLVITKDAIVQGVHFTGGESPDIIARKLLRVNLSDLAAMGATPYGYFLALMLPESADEAWLISFAAGLATDQKTYGLSLLGGDTTRSPHGLSLSLTALGLLPKGTALLRSGAKMGDDIYVSGTIGDAALGLQVAKKEKPVQKELLARYQLPSPRLALGQSLASVATSCIDISDGLVQDLGHICKASHVGTKIEAALVPLSPATRSLSPAIETVLTGGDDYELLFTAPPSAAGKLAAIAKETGTKITRIGEITKDPDVSVRDKNGAEIILPRTGYRHF